MSYNFINSVLDGIDDKLHSQFSWWQADFKLPICLVGMFTSLFLFKKHKIFKILTITFSVATVLEFASELLKAPGRDDGLAKNAALFPHLYNKNANEKYTQIDPLILNQVNEQVNKAICWKKDLHTHGTKEFYKTFSYDEVKKAT